MNLIATLQSHKTGGHRIDAEGAAGGHLLPIAFHATQDPISSTAVAPAQGKSSYIGASTAQGVRRLTPTECERLQGFPDGWTALPGAPDSRRYAAMGDAVTVPVARWIGERLAAIA